MRGNFEDQSELFSYMTLEERVPAGHPLRKVRELRFFARWIGTSASCTRMRAARRYRRSSCCGAAAASILRRSFRAPADGADGL
jgi:hypothetical protein